MIKGDPTHRRAKRARRVIAWRWRTPASPSTNSLIAQGKFNFDSGPRRGRELLARAEPPTAIFAQNDDMAAGVIAAAHDQGISIPDDLSVVGYDDSAIAKIVYPRLTTIHQPVRDMAYGAADMLVAMVEDQPYQELVDHPFALVVRESAGPAPESVSEA